MSAEAPGSRFASPPEDWRGEARRGLIGLALGAALGLLALVFLKRERRR